MLELPRLPLFVYCVKFCEDGFTHFNIDAIREYDKLLMYDFYHSHILCIKSDFSKNKIYVEEMITLQKDHRFIAYVVKRKLLYG